MELSLWKFTPEIVGMILSLLKLVSIAAVLPMPSDTPPTRRISPPPHRELRAVEDVVLSARMADGSRAPSTIVLPQLKNRAEIISYIRARRVTRARFAPALIDSARVPIWVMLPVQTAVRLHERPFHHG